MSERSAEGMSNRSSEGLVSPSDIAQMAGVSRGAVSNWRKRHDNFPLASGGSATTPLFKRRDIVAWLQQQGRSVKSFSADERIWSALNELRSDFPMLEAARLVLFLATVKRSRQASTTVLGDVDTLSADPGSQANLLHDYAARLQGIEGLEYVQSPGAAVERSSSGVIPLADAINAIADSDLTGAVERCLENADRWQGRSGGELGFVGSRTSRLLASLVRPDAATVYDPACGVASALLDVASNNSSARLIGNDIAADALSVAAQRAFLRGVKIELQRGDVLARDPSPGVVADVVLTEPPFGLRWDSSASLSDPRFVHGVPGRGSADLAWIQHAIAHLAPGGRAYVLTSNATLFRGGRDAPIRSKLLAAGSVERVVALPPKMLPHTSIPLALWVLRPQDDGSDVQMIDASDASQPEQHVAEVLNEDTKAASATQIAHRRVPVSDLLADNANLTPNRWLDAADVDDDGIRRSFRNAATSLSNRITSVSRDFATAGVLPRVSTSRTTTAKRLIDDDVLELTPGRREKLHALDPDTQARIVRASDVRDNTLSTRDGENICRDAGTITSDDDREHDPDGKPDPTKDRHVTKPDDVLVTTMHEVRAVVDHTGGHLPSTGVDRLRVTNPSVLRPGYLAAVLTGSWNERLQSGSTIKRAPIRDLEVPLLPLEDQREIEEAYRELHRVRTEARELNQDAQQLQTTILDAIRYNVPLSSPESAAKEKE